jgi:glycosyltransferase involved in cell wall biosynthesis
VVTVHDLAFEDHRDDFARRTGWKYRTLTRRAARSAERVICVSTFTRDDLCARYGVDAEHTRVVPIAPALPVGAAKPPPGRYLLYAGDLRPKKNLLRLVRAWRRLRGEGLEQRLVLAGRDFGVGDDLRAAAGPEPLELPGFVDDGTLDALMRGADALVHPSLYEGFGMAVVEAMVRGCPTILARAAALPETGGDAAQYFEPLDEADIAQAILAVVDDPARSSELIARGDARARELSWTRTAAETVAVYRELL